MIPTAEILSAAEEVVSTGDTAWLLTSASLVLLMTPGVALFYGGMVRSKSVLNMMMMSFGALGLVGVLWVLYGYGMAYGEDVALLVGNPVDWLGLEGHLLEMAKGGSAVGQDYPVMADVGFQAVFAIITVALISGAIADRAKFGPWMIFAGIWATVVYFPVAHWVWGSGWIEELGVIDFAGGTAVHINAGAAALALALVLGKRIGFAREPMRPHNLPLVMLGAALLWFGWFGFNAGSAYGADATAGLVWVNTMVCTCAAVLAWLVTEKIRDGHATSLGAASGAVAGLVAITPACAALSPLGSIALGIAAGVLCALAVGLKYRLGYDDSLDVVGVHLVGGMVGTIGAGLLATSAAAAGIDGLFYGGGAGQLGVQTVSAFGVTAYSFIVAAIIGKVIDLTIGFRVDEETEVSGIDLGVHAESGYDLHTTTGGRQLGSSAATGAHKEAPAPAKEGSKA